MITIQSISNTTVINNYSNITTVVDGYIVKIQDEGFISDLLITKEDNLIWLEEIMKIKENGDIVTFGINGTSQTYNNWNELMRFLES